VDCSAGFDYNTGISVEDRNVSLQNDTAIDTTDREIVSSRLINTPQETVFEAFRNPDILARWWGPAGFTNTFHTFDFQPGGTWEFIMHGPDGTDYPNKSVFVDIVEPQQVVFDHVFPPIFRMTISFEKTEQADKTRFGFRMLFESAEVCEQLKGLCIPANEQNFDRLEAVLAGL
jgi:uncharacterized protein YndB with AHSA1/START domain